MRERDGSLPIGKLSSITLSHVLSRIRKTVSSRTRVGPRIGEDAAVIGLPCCDLVIHSDPITEATQGMGKLAVDVATNDIAVSGACPEWILVTLLLPEGARLEDLMQIVEEIGEEASRLGVDVVGGHTEVSPGLDKPVIVVTSLGITCSGCALPTMDAKPGDLVYQVGYAGLEGTSIILNDFSDLVKSKCGIENFGFGEYELSVVEPACRLSRNRVVRTMHDPTEGGVAGALVEIAIASNTKIIVYYDKILFKKITVDAAECLQIEPLHLISSGSLIAIVPSRLAGEAEAIMRKGNYAFSLIGRVEERSARDPFLVVKQDGKEISYYEPPRDAISILWEQMRRGGFS